MATTRKKKYPKRTPEEKKQLVDELTAKIEQGILSLAETDRYKEYMKFCGAFHRYSFNNTMLILLQCPEATHVAGFHKWKDLGRTVKKGAKGLRILRPIKKQYTAKEKDSETGEEKEVTRSYTSFAPTSVFDISQTEGKEIPSLCEHIEASVENFPGLFAALCTLSDVPVRFKTKDDLGEASGMYRHDPAEIWILQGMSPAMTVKTFVHELAHSKLHGKNGEYKDATRQQKECQAESVAYIVCNALGIDTSGYSFEYVGSWIKADPKEFKKAVSAIQKTASEIMTALEGVEINGEEVAA